MTPQQFALFARIEEDHWWFVGRRRIIRRIIERIIPPARGHTLIDVGCGTGGNLASLARDYHCVGIDPTKDAIAFARQRFQHVQFIHGEFPAGLEGYLPSAAMITCMDVIEHIEQDRPFVQKLIEAMPQGSHLLLTVPADMTLWSQHDVTNDHFRRYDKSGFQQVWSGLPVSVRLVAYFNSRLYPAVKAVRWMHQLRGGAYGQEGTDLKMPSRPINAMLRSLFEGEADALLAMIDAPDKPGFRNGVSLVALLRRHKDGA
jgi:SAM-dependent methyltransferase